MARHWSGGPWVPPAAALALRGGRAGISGWAGVGLCGWLLAALTLLPGEATGQDAMQAQVHAQEGAEHFKAGRFLQAARAFEVAFQHDPTNARIVRYAGRAWQEVGHWDRARRLLERYLVLETDPELKASIAGRLEKLQAASPRAVAEALQQATARFPLGRLERDAGVAWERLGDAASLRKALTLYETARLAATGAERVQIDAAVGRVQGRLIALEASPVTGPQPGVQPHNGVTPPVGHTPQPPPKREPQSDGLGAALWVIGGVLTLGGVGTAAWGYKQATDANAAWKDDAQLPAAQKHYKSFSAYTDDKEGGDTLNLVGAGVAGVGGAVLVWALVRSLTSGPETASRGWQVAPVAGRDGLGLRVGGTF